jgi:molecular chaperone IbpA
VTGTKTKSEDVERNFIHQGIAERHFERKFQLGDHVKVISADIENGLLIIDLEREVPEEMKPRQIEISSKALLDS